MANRSKIAYFYPMPRFLAHENIAVNDTLRMASERSFGLTLAGVAALMGALGLKHGRASAPYWLAAAAVLAGGALVKPAALKPLNRAWTQLGLLLQKIVQPVMLAVIFFVAVTPMALLLRAFGKDVLGLKLDSACKSYWKPRETSRPYSETMRQQF